MQADAYLQSVKLAGNPPMLHIELSLSGATDLNELRRFLASWAKMTLEPLHLPLATIQDEAQTPYRGYNAYNGHYGRH